MKSKLPYILLVLVILGGLIWNNHLDYKMKLLQHNNKSLQDSVTVYKKKNGDLIHSKNILVDSRKNLLDRLDMTQKQLRETEKALKDKAAFVSKAETVVHITDTIIQENTIIREKEGAYPFIIDEKWLKIDGELQVDGHKAVSSIYELTIPANFTIGITENKKLWLETDNPYITVNEIDGGFLEKSSYIRRKKINFSLYAGCGIQYGLNSKQFDMGPQAGIGVSWNF